MVKNDGLFYTAYCVLCSYVGLCIVFFVGFVCCSDFAVYYPADCEVKIICMM